MRPTVRAAAIALLSLITFGSAPAVAEPLRVAVSVPPLAWFAQGLAGPDALVVTALPPGSSPATYDPTPRQALALLDVDLFVAIGVPMEVSLLPALTRAPGGPRICDLGAAVDRLPAGDHHGHDHGDLDPHIWLSPRLAKQMAATLAEAVVAARPAEAAPVARRLEAMLVELDALEAFAAHWLVSPRRPVLVQHPAYGYLAADYGLEVLTIERAGMAPTPAHLGRVLREAREHGAVALVVQPQFADGQVLKAARALDLGIVELDPLAPDYPDAMRRLIASLSELADAGPESRP